MWSTGDVFLVPITLAQACLANCQCSTMIKIYRQDSMVCHQGHLKKERKKKKKRFWSHFALFMFAVQTPQASTQIHISFFVHPHKIPPNVFCLKIQKWTSKWFRFTYICSGVAYYKFHQGKGGLWCKFYRPSLSIHYSQKISPSEDIPTFRYHVIVTLFFWHPQTIRYPPIPNLSYNTSVKW